jgi:hypothetical protein
LPIESRPGPIQKIVLCPTLDCELRNTLFLRSAENEDRNLRHQAKEAVEGLDSAAVGQEEVDEHRRYDSHRLPSRLVFLGEALQALGAEPHPFDLEGALARTDESLSNGVGFPAVIPDQKYGFGHDISSGKGSTHGFEQTRRASVCSTAHMDKVEAHSIDGAAVRTLPHRRDSPVALALPRACRLGKIRCKMGLILIIVVVILLLGGGGGYYGYSRYGGSGLGGALSLVLLVLLVLWFFGGLHIQR